VPPDLAALGVSLRPRRAEDLEFVRDVYVAYRWEEVSATGWPEPVRIAFLHDQHRFQDAHYTKNYEGAAWGIVEVAGERAGRLYLFLAGSDLRIVDIALMPAFRNRGLGTALIHAVFQMAREAGLSRVSIHVEQNNPALRLYERLGFRMIEPRGIYFLMEWTVA
jgi:ribosomal protein S18 acetylase RimI-like enzyme